MQFTIVSAAELPEPDWPFRCPIAKGLRPTGSEPGEAASERWHQRRRQLTDDDVARCPYHEPNWRTIAAIATAALRETVALDDELIELVAMRMQGTPDEARHAQMLFARPIRVAADMYSNGIHRACPLKYMQVTEVPIVLA